MPKLSADSAKTVADYGTISSKAVLCLAIHWMLLTLTLKRLELPLLHSLEGFQLLLNIGGSPTFICSSGSPSTAKRKKGVDFKSTKARQAD
uniref:Uncharacterized protein n=1 Tax=Salix viminalis TaxID=40686 RepID=A0A6N2KLP4_SALVM